MKNAKFKMIICMMEVVLLSCICGCASVPVTTDAGNPTDSQPRTEEPVAAEEENEEADEPDEEADEDRPDEESDPEEGLTPGILAKIGGYYEDGQGDSVEINYADHMVRFIKGGKQDHIYDEKICGYEELEDGYLLKVEWDGEKYTYYYKVENGVEHLYANFDEGWEPGLDPYNHIEGVQEYVKGGVDAEEGSPVSVDEDMEKYVVGTIDLKKEGDYYYMYPLYPAEFRSESGASSYDVPEKVKIAEDAVVGIAYDFYTTLEGEYDEGHFSYEYYDFYDKVDKQLSSKHWFYNGEYMQFDVNGNDMPLTPMVSFDANGEVNLFCEYYRP